MPTLEEGPRAVAEGPGVGEDLVVGFAMGAEGVGDGVAVVATVLLAALYPAAAVKMTV